MRFPGYVFKILFSWIAFTFALTIAKGEDGKLKSVKVGVVGLVHAHVHGILGRSKQLGDIEIVGVSEANQDLAERYAEQYQLDSKLFFSDLKTMLDQAKPEAVTVFSSTFDHRTIVELCAPRGIHVMVEKPLAVNMEHASAMAASANRHGIDLLVNYETTWYASNQEVYRIAHESNKIGELRKIVVHDGHQGPIEIGCNEEFLEWLTDPVLNGGGAITDFGCYGANLITWLMKNERPSSVMAVTQQIKPEKYPKVDDEATIVLTYPKMQGIVQASWNWPYNRKDMEVYGHVGYAHTVKQSGIRLKGERGEEKFMTLKGLSSPRHDPFAYLAGVVRGQVEPDGLSSLENNLIVTEILDAAKASAATGKRVNLAP
jgi:predicted dehydrogenase